MISYFKIENTLISEVRLTRGDGLGRDGIAVHVHLVEEVAGELLNPTYFHRQHLLHPLQHQKDGGLLETVLFLGGTAAGVGSSSSPVLVAEASSHLAHGLLQYNRGNDVNI